MPHPHPEPDMSAAWQIMALEIHGARVGKLLGFLQQDEAGLLARRHELEAELEAVGLDTPEAIRAAWERLDASARETAALQASGPPRAGSRPTLRVPPLRWGRML